MLCTDQIPIFSIQDKRFYFTSISQISDISFNEKVFDQLVLPQSQKELVRVLVENHSRGAAFDDFVEGKGKGLISVLHGYLSLPPPPSPHFHRLTCVLAKAPPE